MVDTTVKSLAESINLPVDALLTKMKEAGLPHSSADDVVTEAQQNLLAFSTVGGSPGRNRSYISINAFSVESVLSLSSV